MKKTTDNRPQTTDLLILILFGLWSVVCGLWSGTALATEPSIEVEVDRDTLSIDETLQLRIIIKGASALTTPDIPELGHFDVVGRSSGNSIEIINGEMSSTKTFQYVLAPRNAGEFSIGPIKIFVEGREYSAGPIRVKVAAKSGGPSYVPHGPLHPPALPQPGPPAFPGFQPPSWPQATEPTQARGQDTFVTAETDKKEAYVGEQVLFTFRLYTAVNLQDAQLDLPPFKDFINEELQKEKKYSVDFNGRRYAVNEWRFALFPTKAGNLETGPTQVKAKAPVPLSTGPFADPFFTGFSMSYRPRTFSAPSAALQVRELPPPPANFTGLVGEFALQSQLSKDQLSLGDTTDLRITVSGKGNIREANLPTLKVSEFFKVYPGKPEVKLEKGMQGLQGRKIFHYALVAERPGTAQLPPLKFSYFNPGTGGYEELESPTVAVQIQGSAVNEPMVTAGLDGKRIVAPEPPTLSDIQPIKGPSDILHGQELGPLGRIVGWSLVVGSPLFFFSLVGWQRHRANLLAHAQDRKKSSAFRRAKSSLSHLKAKNELLVLGGISSILKEYVGDRFTVKGAALTPDEVEALLNGRGVPPEVTRRMVYFFDQLDQWKYGGASQNIPREAQLTAEALDLLREVERAL